MLRTGFSRALLRSLSSTAPQSARISLNAPSQKVQLVSRLCTLSSKRPQLLALAPFAPTTTALVRHQTTQTIPGKVDKKAESEAARANEVGQEDPDKDTDMMAGIKSDLKTIKDTFSLQDVPPEAYRIGLAGVLPYLGTSLSTVYCAWEINHAAATGSGLIMSERTAELALHILEPLQIGYGAVIISFLGAIHWGLEWAGFGGYQGYRRYAIGVVAPAVAWPTILLPAEYALITQFLAFNFLYYVDARACVRGWTPSWYGTYRFVLTFIVGASIVVSLIGRGQIADRVGKLPGPADRVRALRESMSEKLDEEEMERRANMIGKDESGGTEDYSSGKFGVNK